MNKQNRLNVGDVFDVVDGMKVYTAVQERYLYANRAASPAYDVHDVTVGATLPVAGKIASSTKELLKLAKDIERTANNQGIQLSTLELVNMLALGAAKTAAMPKSQKIDLAGEYVVIAAMDEKGDRDYPGGWKVSARRLTSGGKYNPHGTNVSFYQSGCFSAVNENVPVKRVMKMEFV